MRTIDGETLQSIESIYETVLDASRWPEALDRTAETAGAFGAILMVADQVHTDLQVLVTSNRISTHDADAYVSTQLSEDELQWDRSLDGVPPHTILHDTEIWPDREAYYAMDSMRWMSHWNVDHRSAVRLCSHGGWRDTVATLYTEGRGTMTRAEAERLGVLLPHLERAIEIRRPFTLLKRRYQAILTMLDRLGIGVLVLLDDNHVLLANREAERILDERDGPRRLPNGKLAVAEHSSLAAGLADLRSGARAEGATVYLTRGEGKAPYVVDIAPFRETGDELDRPFWGALVFLIDPEHRSIISTRALAAVYSLTDAEAAVCALMANGLSTQEIADIRGVTRDTVKSQSKAVLRKSACANRVELILRAHSIAPPLLDKNGRRET